MPLTACNHASTYAAAVRSARCQSSDARKVGGGIGPAPSSLHRAISSLSATCDASRATLRPLRMASPSARLSSGATRSALARTSAPCGNRRTVWRTVARSTASRRASAPSIERSALRRNRFILGSI
jgi:hypothetical protein